MRKITKRDMILSVANRWYNQYHHTDHWNKRSIYTNELKIGKEVWEKLNNINLSTASSEEVDLIIGRDGWTTITCRECNNEVETAIAFELYDDGMVLFCGRCLSDALSLLKNGDVR